MGGSAGEEPGSRMMAIGSCFPCLLHLAEPGPGHLPAYKSPRGYIDWTLAPSQAAEKAQWVGFNGPPPLQILNRLWRTSLRICGLTPQNN